MSEICEHGKLRPRCGCDAAARIDELEAENERLRDDAYQLSDDYTLCDCCESLTTDAVDAGGHMQCRSCTRVAELEALLVECKPLVDWRDPLLTKIDVALEGE